MLFIKSYLKWIKFDVDLILQSAENFDSAWIYFRSYSLPAKFRVDLISRWAEFSLIDYVIVF